MSTFDVLDLFRLVTAHEVTAEQVAQAEEVTARDVETLVHYVNGANDSPGGLVPLIEQAVELGRLDPLWRDYALAVLSDLRTNETDAPTGADRKA